MMTASEKTPPSPAHAGEDAYALEPGLAAAVAEAAARGDHEGLRTLVDPLHEADLADLIEQVEPEARRALIQEIGGELAPEAVLDLEEDTRAELIAAIPPGRLVEIVSELESDDAVSLLETLDEARREEVLKGLGDVERGVLEQSLSYPEGTAGRLMQRELVAAPAWWTVGRTIDHMRTSDRLPYVFYEVIVVDPAFHPLGTVPLSQLMGSVREVALSSLMRADFRTLLTFEPQADVAYAFRQYHLVSAPVVDDAGRLVGVINIDDAVEILDEEAEEDLLRLSGVGDEGLSERVPAIAGRRLPWLAANLATAVLASIVIGLFDKTIEAIVALAVLMPIVASMGGNAGTQTLTVAVRALATRDLTKANAMRLVRRELYVGVVNGLLFALTVAIIAQIWYGDWGVTAILAAAMIVNMTAAGIAGIVTPLGLQKIGVDPALASGAFVTAVTDIVGFLAFLAPATLLLL